MRRSGICQVCDGIIYTKKGIRSKRGRVHRECRAWQQATAILVNVSTRYPELPCVMEG